MNRLPRTGATRRQLVTETALVLGVSLGASAIWAVLALIRKLTEQVGLGDQTTAMNQAVTPDRPWLDLAYQLAGIGIALVPAFLALHLLTRDDARALRLVGADARRPVRDLVHGAALAAIIGIPGLGLYLAARAMGLNTTIAAANLDQTWWAVPVLVLAAAQNAVLEEIVMVAYLFTRWGQRAGAYRRSSSSRRSSAAPTTYTKASEAVSATSRWACCSASSTPAPAASCRSSSRTRCSTSSPSSATRCCAATSAGSDAPASKHRPPTRSPVRSARLCAVTSYGLASVDSCATPTRSGSPARSASKPSATATLSSAPGVDSAERSTAVAHST